MFLGISWSSFLGVHLFAIFASEIAGWENDTNSTFDLDNISYQATWAGPRDGVCFHVKIL